VKIKQNRDESGWTGLIGSATTILTTKTTKVDTEITNRLPYFFVNFVINLCELCG